MSSVTKIEENVKRITRKREFEQAKRTDGCLTSTCPTRLKWMKENGTEIPLDKCDADCCYHPDYVPDIETSLGRSRRKEGQFNEIYRRVNHCNNSLRREDGSWTDPSPF